MQWEHIQRQVDEDVDATVSDEHIRLVFNDGRILPVLGTYNTSETIASDSVGNSYYGIEEHVSISNRYLPQTETVDKIRVIRTDMTGPCPAERYYTVQRAENLRVGRTRLVLQAVMPPQETRPARWSPNEQRIDGPPYKRWSGA